MSIACVAVQFLGFADIKGTGNEDPRGNVHRFAANDVPFRVGSACYYNNIDLLQHEQMDSSLFNYDLFQLEQTRVIKPQPDKL